mgnify:CR=1 FL=1
MSRLVQYDRRLLSKFPSLVGIDEAGRGCLAGPVMAAAVWLDGTFFLHKLRRNLAEEINDSKKLSAEDREEIYQLIQGWAERGLLRWASATADVLEIDAYNILGATRLAMHRCLQALADAHAGPCPFAAAASGSDVPLFSLEDRAWPRVLVDGKPLKPFAWQHQAVVGGDGKSLAVAMASVVAKVRRDRLMAELERKFPGYGFAENKGYGTAQHVAALKEKGPCEQHRPLFLRGILREEGVAEETHPELPLA